MDCDSPWWDATYQTLSRLEQRWIEDIPNATEFFAYDSLPVALFIPGIEMASQFTSGRRFLDVGSGIGTKLAFMHAMGWEASGIERHAPYVNASRELIPEAPVEVADIRDIQEFDADLVYMYRPGVSEETEATLERHVIKGMVPGSLLFLPARTPTLDIERIDRHVWRV